MISDITPSVFSPKFGGNRPFKDFFKAEESTMTASHAKRLNSNAHRRRGGEEEGVLKSWTSYGLTTTTYSPQMIMARLDRYIINELFVSLPKTGMTNMRRWRTSESVSSPCSPVDEMRNTLLLHKSATNKITMEQSDIRYAQETPEFDKNKNVLLLA
jgi:hypothetical protein